MNQKNDSKKTTYVNARVQVELYETQEEKAIRVFIHDLDRPRTYYITAYGLSELGFGTGYVNTELREFCENMEDEA